MTEIAIEYLGDLRCRARHGPSGDELLTDAPKDNEGQGRNFSPTDLVGTAMGTCMATIMGIVARRHSIDLAGMTLAVTKEMAADPHRRIGRLKVVFRLPRKLPPDQIALLRKAAESCPVHRSLAPSTKVELRFEV
jgi:putative redox protein